MKHIKYILIFLFTLSASIIYADKTRTTTCNGQVVKERFFTTQFGDGYAYSIESYSARVDSIMKTKLPFSIDVKYPTWSSKQSFKDLENYAIKCLSIKGKELAKEYVFDISYLLNDNGEIICYRLWSNKSLYDICTTEEIISIFDEISKFKFPVPVTTRPKESVGYEMMSVELY